MALRKILRKLCAALRGPKGILENFNSQKDADIAVFLESVSSLGPHQIHAVEDHAT